MTYSAQETSSRAGQPIELYRFAVGTDLYLFTSADEDYTVGTETYTASPIKRGGVGLGGNGEGNDITLRVPRDNAVAGLFLGFVPGISVWLTIYRVHATDMASEVLTYWKGRVRSVQWEGSTANMRCEPIHSVMDRDGLRRPFASMCPYMVFDSSCLVPQGPHMAIITAADVIVSGKVLSSDLFATKGTGYYQAGHIVRNSADFRMIVAHTTNSITLDRAFPLMEPTDDLVLLAGCDGALTTCRDKFNNLLNYGGFNYISGLNPFDVGLEG